MSNAQPRIRKLFVDPNPRKQILARKRLCFSCTGERHLAAESKPNIDVKYVMVSIMHQSDRNHAPKESGMTTNFISPSTVVHPVVAVVVCRYILFLLQTIMARFA